MRPETGDLQLGELQVELGLPHGRLLRRDGRFRDALGLRPLVEGLLRDRRAAERGSRPRFRSASANARLAFACSSAAFA